MSLDRLLVKKSSRPWRTVLNRPTAALVRASDPDQARAVLTAGRYVDIEVHNWAFGGRPE